MKTGLYLEHYSLSNKYMLDIATVLTTMFTYIDDFCKRHPSMKPGPDAKVSNSELVTINLFCELVGKHSESEHVRFAEQWLRGYFPHMIDQSRYNRRMKYLTPLINDVRTYVLEDMVMALADAHILDSTPIPVITFQRAHFTPLFPEAEYGRCAARNMTYFGFKLHLVTDTQGIPIHFDITPANVPDIAMMEELLSKSSRKHLVLGDKGYLSEPIKQNLTEQYDVDVRTSKRKNQKDRESRGERRILNGWRQKIEIVNGILKDHFGIERIRTKTFKGFLTRIMSKLTALTFGIFMNRLFGRPILHISSLVN